MVLERQVGNNTGHEPMWNCELSVYEGPLVRVQAACAATQIVQYSPKKTLKLQFEHDSIAGQKKNDQADLLAVWDDDSTCYIVYDIVYDVAYYIE